MTFYEDTSQPKVLTRLQPLPLFTARPQVKFVTVRGEVAWERCVYNAGAIRIDGVTYVLYRALGEDGFSRLGLWTTRDGVTEEKRLDWPVFAEEADFEGPADLAARCNWHRKNLGMVREVGGCEDPRLMLVDGMLYMTYTAYGEDPLLAIARIEVEQFLRLAKAGAPYAEWTPHWERLGVAIEGVMDKDAYILPQQCDDHWILYHRIHPDIQVVRFREFSLPFPSIGDTVLTPRPDMWDCDKIGGGAAVLKTTAGWLHIYHGVGRRHGRRAYMLGAFVTALDDPAEVTYRSPEPILVPEEECELKGWVDDVVFTCGVAPVDKDSNDLLTLDDEILIYYGGADEVMCVARGRIGDIVGAS